MIDIKDCTIDVSAEYEYETFVGNISAVDEETDKKAEEYIRQELDNGNMWAWCTIIVSVTYRKILTATNALGYCSYDSEQDFIENSGYYEDMLAACLIDIQEQLEILK